MSRFLIFIFVGGLLCQSETASASVIFGQDPVLYWRLGEAPGSSTAVNVAGGPSSVGAAGDGSYQAGILLGQASLDPFSSDPSVRGQETVDSYVLLDPFAGMPTSEISASMWIQGGTNSGFQAFWGYASSNSNNNAFTVGTNNNQLSAFINGAQTLFSDITPLDNTPHHIGVSWRASDGQLQIYLDGVLAGQAIVSAGNALTAGGVLALGTDLDAVSPGYGVAADQSFNGFMDEFAVFNRVLTADEFAAQAGVASVPEPSSFALLVIAGMGCTALRRMKKLTRRNES